MKRVGVLGTLLVAGCTLETGLLLEVQGPDGVSSTAAGVTQLEYIVAHKSWCERWVQDQSASRTTVDVNGRNLDDRPYSLLVHPVHLTDIDDPVFALALARAAGGNVIGEAVFHPMRFQAGDVESYQQRVSLLGRRGESDGPSYASADGCVCLPGQPWIGNGTGSGCDLLVPSSFDRLVDTAGCELPPNSAGLPVGVCDGQNYPGEVIDRQLPCFAPRQASGQQRCAVTTRGCHDTDGYAYDQECRPDDTAPLLPSSALCNAYRTCEHNACGDLVDCFRRALTPTALTCTLRIDPTAPAGTIRPCADGAWRAALSTQATGAACVATVINSVAQSPFTVGFRVPMQSDVQPVSTICPPALEVQAIDAQSSEQVPPVLQLDLTVGDHLVHATVRVALGCADGVASLVCQ